MITLIMGISFIMSRIISTEIESKWEWADLVILGGIISLIYRYSYSLTRKSENSTFTIIGTILCA